GEEPGGSDSQSDGSAWESGNSGPPNGVGVGADNGFGEDTSIVKNDDDVIPAGDPFADRKGTGSSQSNPPWLPTGNSSSPWESMKKRVWRYECKRLRREIKDRIRWHYGDDADFDEVNGS